MEGVPTVAAWREKYRLLRVVCPNCSKAHRHWVREMAYNAIVEAKCWPRDLPRQLRGMRMSYRLAVMGRSRKGTRRVIPFPKLAPIQKEEDAMTEHASLFAEMSAAANLLRAGGAHVRRDDLWFEWRQVQQCRMPALSEEESLALFDTWIEEDLCRLMAERDQALCAILKAVDESAARNRGQLIVCASGTVLHDAGDPAVMAEHAPHVQAARR